MSRIIYATTTSGPKWTPPNIIFSAAGSQQGALSTRQGISFGASWASVLLGPDLAMPGAQSNNPPSVADYPWAPAATFAGGPNVTFAQDLNHAWIRGHLINGRWHGSGNNWNNLTPLTSSANSNHKAVEAYMGRYLINSLNYEQSANQTDWYGIYYVVQCSQAPFSAAPVANDLYAYAPEFIKVTWRAVRIQKPVNQALAAVVLNPITAPLMPVILLPFAIPAPPAIVGWPMAALPAGNIAGGAVLGAPIIPAAQANGFDGEIEIHQA